MFVGDGFEVSKVTEIGVGGETGVFDSPFGDVFPFEPFPLLPESTFPDGLD